MTFRLFVSSIAVVLVSSTSQSPGPKISHPIVLLPDDARATFEITAENGCFEFTTDREDLLKLTHKLIVDKCLRSVLVSMNPGVATSRDSMNSRAVVTATETTTKSELRSEVYFSSISRVEILTRIRRLSVGELEAIQVQGYDKFGNTFSSLEGVPFAWQLIDPSTGKKSQIVGIVPLKSTEYALSQERIGLEENGHQSDLLIVVGWTPGKTSISVAVPLTSITSIPVSMSVVENFHPKPSAIAIPFCGHSQISLFTRTGGTGGPISMPNPAYSFGVPPIFRSSVLVNTDGKVSSLNSTSPIQTSVSITDTRTVGENEESVRVCIGRPSELEVIPSVLFPVAGEGFELKIVARSADCPKMEMHLSADADIQLTLSSDVTTPRRLSASSWEVAGLPKGTRLTVSASLGKIASPSVGCTWIPENPIVAKPVVIETVEKVSLSEKEVILPQSQDFFTIRVQGGSGQYRARTDDNFACNSVSFHNSVMQVKNCSSGPLFVEDMKNPNNYDQVVFHRVPLNNKTHFKLGSNATMIEAFIGFEKPFVDSIVFGNFYNCSSLIQSIHIANESIAKLELSSSGEPRTCGTLTVTQLVPGRTDLVIKSLHGSSIERIPIIVHSPFKIKPETRLFNSSLGAVVAVNATFGFSVAGGSLGTLRLPRNEELIILSHPWVADVGIDVAKNKFRVVCKTVGKTTVAIAYSKSSAVAIECVDPKSVMIGPIEMTSSTGADSLFVTCGHKENHVMRSIGIDSRGEKIDAIVFEKIFWNRKESSLPDLIIPPMDCNTESLIEVELRLKNGKSLKSKSTVKARNTVRSTLGPLLASKPIYIPCKDGEGSPMNLAVGFVGGSGYYAIVNEETDSGFVPDDSKSISIGSVGSFNVRFSNEMCSKKLRTLTVEDTQLKDEKTRRVQIQIRQLPVTEMVASVAPESPSIILRNEWVYVNREVRFSDGTAMDSETDGRWFAVTTDLFQWTTDAAKVELRTDIESGMLALEYTGEESRVSLKIFSASFPNIQTTLEIAAMTRPQFQTAFSPKWSLVPFTGNYELSVVGVDSIDSVKYDFESEDDDRIKLVRLSPLSVLIDPLASKTASPATSVRFLGRSSDSGREIFTISQEIEIQSSLSQILINDRSTRDPMIVHRDVAVPFFVNGEFVVPPVDLGVDSCAVTWTIGTEVLDSSAQSISHTFANIGDFPVKVTVHCEHLGPAADARIFVRVIDPVATRKIPPLAILMAGKVEYQNTIISSDPFITPQDETSMVVKVSESELGVVLFRSLGRAEFDSPSDISLLVGATRNINIVLKDSLGFKMVVPEKMDGLTVGTSRPSIINIIGGTTISITGRSAGCAIVFAHIEKILIGLIRVCVENSVVPFAPSFVLTKHSSMTFRSAASSPNLIRLTNDTFTQLVANVNLVSTLVSRIDFEKKEIEIIGDLESVLGKVGIRDFEFVYPNSNEWVIESRGIVNTTNLGVVGRLSEGSSSISLGQWTRIPIQVSSINRLIPSPDKTFPKFLSHNQFAKQSVSVLPVTKDDSILTTSPLIDHKLDFTCQTDASEFFAVTEEPIRPGDDSMTCVVTPIVSSLAWVPKKITISVCLLIHSVCENFSFGVEPHFHLVAGEFQLPVPEQLAVASDTVELTITHLPPGTSYNDCQVIQRMRYVELSQVSSDTGKFTVSRTSPTVSESRLTVICKTQEIDVTVKFFATSIKNSEFGQTFDFSDSLSHAIYNLAWLVLKVLASVLAVAGVGLLFQRTRPPPPTILKEKKSFGRLTAASPKEFTPLPHPDKDTFFGGSSITRRSHID